MARTTKRKRGQQRPRRDPGAIRAVAKQPRPLVANLIFGVLPALYAIALIRTAWLSDDAYITFRTIDNFIHGYGLRWNAAERVQSFTNPLWMFLLAGLYALTREIYLTALITSIGVSLAVVALVGWRGRRLNVHPSILAAALGVLVASRAFVDYSTSGLENPLTHLLLVAFVGLFLDEGETSPRRLFLLSLLTGLATLNRMDSLLLFFPALAWEFWRLRSWKSVLLVLVGFAPFFLWEVFSVIYYGFPFPNTAYAKLRTGISRLDYWEHGLAYFKDSLNRDPITLVTIIGGVVVALIWRNGKRLALVTGVLMYVVYILNIGGDFMSGRFLAAPLLVSVMLLLEVAVHLRAIWPRHLLPVAVLLVGCIGATPTLFSGKDCGRKQNVLLDDTGVADERCFYYSMTGLLADAPVSTRPFSEASDQGKKARLHNDPLMVDGAVGFSGFFAGPGTHIVDFHALGDPLLSRVPMVKSDPLFNDFCVQLKGHPCSGAWRIGHYLRNVPAGYLESMLAGENRLRDDNLRKFYEPIRVITRGPIWSRERWVAIAEMNLGLYDELLGPLAPVDYQPTAFTEAYEEYPDIPSIALLGGAAKEYVERGAPENAIECYQKLVALDATSAMAWNNLGNLLLWRGDAEAGEAALLESINLRQSHLQPYVALGDQMEKTGRGAEARSLFQRLAGAGDKMAAEYLRRMDAAR